MIVLKHPHNPARWADAIGRRDQPRDLAQLPAWLACRYAVNNRTTKKDTAKALGISPTHLERLLAGKEVTLGTVARLMERVGAKATFEAAMREDDGGLSEADLRYLKDLMQNPKVRELLT